MESFTQIIDALGGSAVVGRGIDERDGTVRQWRLRDRIPPEYWPKIVAFAEKQEITSITYGALADLAARRRKASVATSTSQAAA